MSHFICKQCGVTQVDSGAAGYTSGCCHYPPRDERPVEMQFGGDRAATGFYDGAFYCSEKARGEGKAVHPITWTAH